MNWSNVSVRVTSSFVTSPNCPKPQLCVSELSVLIKNNFNKQMQNKFNLILNINKNLLSKVRIKLQGLPNSFRFFFSIFTFSTFRCVLKSLWVCRGNMTNPSRKEKKRVKKRKKERKEDDFFCSFFDPKIYFVLFLAYCASGFFGLISRDIGKIES